MTWPCQPIGRAEPKVPVSVSSDLCPLSSCPLPLVGERQKSFVRNLVVFDGVDAYLGHLHSFF
jgi:hypothetical protein